MPIKHKRAKGLSREPEVRIPAELLDHVVQGPMTAGDGCGAEPAPVEAALDEIRHSRILRSCSALSRRSFSPSWFSTT